jgi:cbb3-type cytochrome oxidase maturation protein
MTGLLILIPVALFLGALGLAAFLWSLRSGQYDDLDGAAVRILHDEELHSLHTIEGKVKQDERP